MQKSTPQVNFTRRVDLCYAACHHAHPLACRIEMSLLLGEHLVSKMVEAVPVFGGRGKLLEYWAFQISYNCPLSIRRMTLGR